MRNARIETFDDTQFGGTELTLPQARTRAAGPGHPSAWMRAPRIERIGAPRGEPKVALRILAEPALIDAAFGADLPGWGGFDAVVQDILMGRR
jgi:hypothetical protein